MRKVTSLFAALVVVLMSIVSFSAYAQTAKPELVCYYSEHAVAPQWACRYVTPPEVETVVAKLSEFIRRAEQFKEDIGDGDILQTIDCSDGVLSQIINLIDSKGSHYYQSYEMRNLKNWVKNDLRICLDTQSTAIETARGDLAPLQSTWATVLQVLGQLLDIMNNDRKAKKAVPTINKVVKKLENLRTFAEREFFACLPPLSNARNKYYDEVSPLINKSPVNVKGLRSIGETMRSAGRLGREHCEESVVFLDNMIGQANALIEVVSKVKVRGQNENSGVIAANAISSIQSTMTSLSNRQVVTGVLANGVYLQVITTTDQNGRVTKTYKKTAIVR